MSPIVSSTQQLIGQTPLLELRRLREHLHLPARLLAKVESFNVAGSVKDRVALAILNQAEKEGRLTPQTTIVEPSSGNTGIALAALAAARGYKLIIVMPESMSLERRQLIAAYGAQVVLTPAAQGMAGAVAKAQELVESLPQAILAGQFTNPANLQAHYQTTGPEIWEATGGDIAAFVAGVGTGGTLTGVGRYLKEKNPHISIVAVEPADSPVLSGGKPGPHALQGIGAGFIPAILDTTIYNQIITITTAQAWSTVRTLAQLEGLLVGISSGAALYAALQLASQEERAGQTIVTLLPDGGERYLSNWKANEYDAL